MKHSPPVDSRSRFRSAEVAERDCLLMTPGSTIKKTGIRTISDAACVPGSANALRPVLTIFHRYGP